MKVPGLLRKPLVLLGIVMVVAIVVGTRPRMIEVDESVVIVDGRGDAWTSAESTPALSPIGGTLRLVGGRCVGLDRADGSGEVVVVWAPGTKASSTGLELEIETQDGTFVLGDRVEAETMRGRDFQGLADGLPTECRGRPLVDLHDPTSARG